MTLMSDPSVIYHNVKEQITQLSCQAGRSINGAFSGIQRSQGNSSGPITWYHQHLPQAQSTFIALGVIFMWPWSGHAKKQ